MALPSEEDWPSPEVLPEEAVTQPGVPHPTGPPGPTCAACVHPAPDDEADVCATCDGARNHFELAPAEDVPATERCPAPSLVPGPDWEEVPVGFDTEPPPGPAA
jgi:hypothetical protein